MTRWKGKPFGYLEGLEATDDAPVMDNPARLYCPKCRAEDRLVCDEPGFCGELRPMKPLPDAFEAGPAPKPPHMPRHGSKELPRPQLDTSRGQRTVRELEGDYPPVIVEIGRRRGIPEIPGRLMGRRTTLTPVEGKEYSWDWFMENMQKGLDGEELEP